MNNYPVPITINDSLAVSSSRGSFMIPEYNKINVSSGGVDLDNNSIGMSGQQWVIAGIGIIASLVVVHYMLKRLRR